ncbi:MAG: FAD-dependent oxidoreductase [Microcoleaceae cyanobacterium]
MEELTTEVLVIGAGTGGTAAAIQAARRGAKTILVSEFPWLGGMLTSAGVSAPDGNELLAFQTGLWGAFLKELNHYQADGDDRGWVSFFNFDPRVGAEIFANWVRELPNLQWIQGENAIALLKKNNQIMGVQFPHLRIYAKIIIDGTELGDLLELGEIPYYWGWELQEKWGEPSSPIFPNQLTQNEPIQGMTWVVIMQDFGEGENALEIPPSPLGDTPEKFMGAWEGYTPEQFINYGRLPGGLLMINWPDKGNDYSTNLGRLIKSESEKREVLQESFWHSLNFARFIQQNLGRRYGLANNIFPKINQKSSLLPSSPLPSSFFLLPSCFALHPYYRESRRLEGLTTIREQDILPMLNGRVAALPINERGECDTIAIGNYANDHHYTSGKISLKSKSIRWGGRWTGTPFTIPYRALIPREIDGFLVCEKNISVSHIANGATRLQPVVMGIGQSAGMAAALCVEKGCQPRELSVRLLQKALLEDPWAPGAVIPLFNLNPDDSEWLFWQNYYLEHPQDYPITGNYPSRKTSIYSPSPVSPSPIVGIFHRKGVQDYTLTLTRADTGAEQQWTLVTLDALLDEALQHYPTGETLAVEGKFHHRGHWLLVENIILKISQ